MTKPMLTALIGGPIQYSFDADGLFNIKLKILIDSVINIVQDNRYNVLSAHIYENYGELDVSGEYSEVCLRDYQWMKKCDVYIAILPLNTDRKIIYSSGTSIELGWASALKKQIILIRDSAPIYSHLVLGLNSITRVEEVYIDNNNFELLLHNILIDILS